MVNVNIGLGPISYALRYCIGYLVWGLGYLSHDIASFCNRPIKHKYISYNDTKQYCMYVLSSLNMPIVIPSVRHLTFLS